LLQPCSEELAPRVTDKRACQKKGGTKVPHSMCEFRNSQKMNFRVLKITVQNFEHRMGEISSDQIGRILTTEN
jgi:hypothetical protein